MITVKKRKIAAFITALLIISEAVSPCILASSEAPSIDVHSVIEEAKESPEILDETTPDEQITEEIEVKEETLEPIEDNPKQEDNEPNNTEISYSTVQTKTVSNLVVFVRFKDDLTDEFNLIEYEYAKPKRSVWTRVKEIYNSTITTASESAYDCNIDESFAKYIFDVTGGKYNVVNTFPQEYSEDGRSKIGYLQLDRTREQFGDNSEAVIDQVITAFNNGTLTLPTGTTLDNLEDGVVDNLTIIIQGEAEEEVDSLMRSHKGTSATEKKIAGNLVRTYNILCGNGVKSDGAGLIAHEFLHSLGLPDLYRYFSDGNPVGAWDIMAAEGAFLQYPLSYQRHVMGWLSLPEITESGEYYLTAQLAEGGNKGFIVRSPMNETEFFVVEYREKNVNAELKGFEQKVPATGVIVYRVNTSVEGLTNSQGNDYIYVFRDGETGLHDSHSSNNQNITEAALSAGESRGSSDFTKQFSDNTIFYSDGSNSGLVITAEGTEADGRMKISVQYPNYASLDLWNKESGADIASNVSYNSLADDGQGNIYVAYVMPIEEGFNSYGEVHVKKWDGETWSELAAVGSSDGMKPEIICFKGDIYISYANRSGSTVIKKYSNSQWTSVFTAADTYSTAQLAADENAIFAVYANGDSSALNLIKLNSAKTAFSLVASKTGQCFAKPALSVYKGYALLVSCDVIASSPTEIEFYNERWITLGQHTLAGVLDVAVSGDNVWVLAKPSMTDAAAIKHYDGEQWLSDVTFAAGGSYTEYALGAYANTPVVMASPSNICKVFVLESGAFAQRGFMVRSGAASAGMLLSNDTVYVSANGENGALALYSKPMVPPDPTVTTVTVSPSTANVNVGATQAFSAVVVGANNPAQTVTWDVEGEKSSNTVISEEGVLSVGGDETAATLSVKATSTVDTAKSGTARVTVCNRANEVLVSTLAELKAALASAGENELNQKIIKLNANITAGESDAVVLDDIWKSYILTLASGKYAEIDLNGKTLTNTTENQNIKNFILNYGNLTILDSSADMSGKIISNYYLLRSNEGNVTINSGSFARYTQNQNTWCDIFNSGGTLTVNAGNFDLSIEAGGSTFLNGGTIGGNEYSIQLTVNCTVSVSNSVVFDGKSQNYKGNICFGNVNDKLLLMDSLSHDITIGFSDQSSFSDGDVIVESSDNYQMTPSDAGHIKPGAGCLYEFKYSSSNYNITLKETAESRMVNALQAGENYRLEENITFTSPVQLNAYDTSKESVLNLNGHTITFTDDTESGFIIGNNYKLTVCSKDENGTKVEGAEITGIMSLFNVFGAFTEWDGNTRPEGELVIDGVDFVSDSTNYNRALNDYGFYSFSILSNGGKMTVSDSTVNNITQSETIFGQCLYNGGNITEIIDCEFTSSNGGGICQVDDKRQHSRGDKDEHRRHGYGNDNRKEAGRLYSHSYVQRHSEDSKQL